MESKITPELIEQAKKAESVAALLALAKENGIDLTAERAEKLCSEWHTTKELSDDELNSVAGGCGEGPFCPKCGAEMDCGTVDTVKYGPKMLWVCGECGYRCTAHGERVY